MSQGHVPEKKQRAYWAWQRSQLPATPTWGYEIINLGRMEKRGGRVYGSYVMPALVLDSGAVNIPVLITHALTASPLPCLQVKTC